MQPKNWAYDILRKKDLNQYCFCINLLGLECIILLDKYEDVNMIWLISR